MTERWMGTREAAIEAVAGAAARSGIVVRLGLPVDTTLLAEAAEAVMRGSLDWGIEWEEVQPRADALVEGMLKQALKLLALDGTPPT